MFDAQTLRESVLTERHQHISALIAAPVDLAEPAKTREWYLPLAGREETTYPDRESAQAAAVRLCVILGVPICTPLSR
jgi:hypothetical protein